MNPTRTVRAVFTTGLAVVGLAACTQLAAPTPTPMPDARPADSPASDARVPEDAGAIPGMRVTDLPGHEGLGVDTTVKDAPRLLPPETLLRTYGQIFGGMAPIALQTRLRGSQGTQLFDAWTDYLGVLGIPDLRRDLPRGTQTNALMLAAFERIGVALCDRAVENDLATNPVRPVAQRLVFAFDTPTSPALDVSTFTARFDVLHRTFLGYPVRLAPQDRVPRFLALYQQTLARHTVPDAGRSLFAPWQAGWATVCYALIRHPEFHLY